MNTRDLFQNYVLPVVTLSGAIIGVGFFSLPYIALKVGVWLMLLYFIALGALVVLVHLIFGEIALLTPDFKRFPGFVKFYLGKWLGSLYLVSTISGSFGVLLVYLIIGSDFLVNIFGGSQLVWALIFWGLITFIIYFGIKIISKIEFGVIIFLFLVLFLIFINGFSQIKLSNIFVPNFKLQISNLLLPYGPIIFSLWGMGIIPEIEEMLGKNKKNIKKIIAISFLVVSTVYLFFTFLILGIAGENTTETALTGLKNYLGPIAFSFSLFLGVITTFTASVMLGLTLKKVFIYDLGIKKIPAWLITCFTPLVLF
ncbi:MAG: aromatic amino acid transport family protein, partial [bacterium]|nr:aromatic amino acid transport family protein [bacterium]